MDNNPSGSIVIWSLVSVVLLLAGVGRLAWHIAAQQPQGRRAESRASGQSDPLLALDAAARCVPTLKYFWVVAALILAQVGPGGITAHYGVGGRRLLTAFRWRSGCRTRCAKAAWHTQLGIFWIATAWLATGLFIAPAVAATSRMPARWGELPLRLPAHHRGRLAGGRMARRAAEASGSPPISGSGTRLRVRRSGPVLADLPLRWPVPLAGPDDPGDLAGAAKPGRETAICSHCS